MSQKPYTHIWAYAPIFLINSSNINIFERDQLNMQFKVSLTYMYFVIHKKPCFFVELDFEIAVDQQTKAHDRGTATILFGIFLAQFCQITLKRSKQCFGVVYSIATNLLNTYTKFYQNRIKIGRVISKILYLGIRNIYYRFCP